MPKHLGRSQHRRAEFRPHQRAGAGARAGVPARPFGEPVPHREHPVRVGAELAAADGRDVDHPVAVDDHEAAMNTSDAHEVSFRPGSGLGCVASGHQRGQVLRVNE
jgi:hypothetical protein